jgi:MFS family permease
MSEESKLIERPGNRVLAIITLSHLAQHFTIGISVLFPNMMQELGLNYTGLGIITGTSRIIAGFLQMAWSLLNRYTSRRVLLGIGNLLISIGSFLMGTATNFRELLFGDVIRGSGQAAQHPVGTSILSHKFSKARVSWALSIHYGLGYVGNIVSPIILSAIALTYSWRLAVYTLAIVPIVSGVLVLYYLRYEKSASKSLQSNVQSNLWDDLKSVIRIRDAPLLIAAQAFAVGGTGMGVIITYTPLFLTNQLHVGLFETSVIYSIGVVGGVLGTMFFGHFAGKLGNLQTASIVFGSGSLLILFLTLHTSFTLLLIPHLFFIGVTSFSSSSLLQSHLAAISTPNQRDVLLGLYFTIGFGLSSIWTALTGFIIDLDPSFTLAWILRAILGTIAFLVITYTFLTRTKSLDRIIQT